MATQIYTARVNGDDRLNFRGDFAQASSPLEIGGDEGFQSTPFQVADARHRPAIAAEILNDWCRSQGGEAWSEDEVARVAIED